MTEVGRLGPFSRVRLAFANGWKKDLHRSCAPALLGIGLPDQGERHAGWIAGSSGRLPRREPRRRCGLFAADRRQRRRHPQPTLIGIDEGGTVRNVR
jgi:hypothetical protein